jgi:hypothetical protein
VDLEGVLEVEAEQRVGQVDDRVAEALAELEICRKRRGEAADLFSADMTTLRYLPPLYYWLGRAQEGLGTKDGARASFQRAALFLPKGNGIMDARLLGAARYLQQTTRVTGLPASAPAMAGRVQYNVGALLSSPGG